MSESTGRLSDKAYVKLATLGAPPKESPRKVDVAQAYLGRSNGRSRHSRGPIAVGNLGGVAPLGDLLGQLEAMAAAVGERPPSPPGMPSFLQPRSPVVLASGDEIQTTIGVLNDRVRSNVHLLVPFGLGPASEAQSPNQGMLFVVHHLARVMEAVIGHPAAAERFSDPPWMASGRERPLEAAWMRLSAALAASNREMRDRQATLDMEAYALELEQQSRLTIDLPDAYRAFVDELVEGYSARFRSWPRPVFVFAVLADDVSRLRQQGQVWRSATRTLAHERVVFVLEAGLA